MRTFDDFEFFFNFMEALENREKNFRMEGVPISFSMGRNNKKAFCVCAHFDEVLLPFTSGRNTRANLKVIETDRGDYVADYLDKINNVIRQAMSIPVLPERCFVFFGDDPDDVEKPYFWSVFKQNIRDYVGWINGVKPLRPVYSKAA